MDSRWAAMQLEMQELQYSAKRSLTVRDVYLHRVYIFFVRRKTTEL